MILVLLTAFAAVCGAAKLDTSYLPPISARIAGGSPGALLAPLDGSSQGPAGSYTNEVQGVVVDAVNPGTRTSGQEPTGLGGPRTSYGSTNSKVGDAAFRSPVAGLANPGSLTRIAPGFGSFVESDEAQGDKASGNSLKFTSDVGSENYSYGFETDNGISVGEQGEAADGVKTQGGGYKGDDGSHDAQKYNDGGDYSSNGAASNNGGSTIGVGDATFGGSYVSQSGQAQRPTSGVLVGTYNPGSATSQSSQGNSAQGFTQSFGNKQADFVVNKDQSGFQSLGVSGSSSSIGLSGQNSGAQGSQSGFSSQSTENRFGVQSTKSEGSYAHAQATVGGTPARSPSLQNGVSAYSSAVSSGSGIASAFASTGGLSSELKNEQTPLSNSFGSAGQSKYGSDSSAGASIPASATASASVSGSQTQFSGFQTNGKSPNSPSSASASATVSGNQQSQELIQQVPSRFGESQKTQFSGGSGTYVSSTQKPFIGQEQGSDNSYYYKQPSKPFVTPTAVPSKQNFNNNQNFPAASSVTGQYQGTGSSGYNGITQAAISPFTSSSSFTQTASQSSQFGSKPATQSGQSSQQTSTQFGSTQTLSGNKPIVQSQAQYGQSSNSQNTDSSLAQTQQYQGTIYQYNKPATALSATASQTKPGQLQTDSRFGTQQSSSKFGSQSTFQQTQTGSNVQTSQFGQKPIVGSQVSGSSYQFGSSGSQQKPVATQGSTVSSNQYGLKPQTTQGSSFTYTQSQTQFGQKPVTTTQTGVTSQQTQFGSTASQYGLNSQSTFSSGAVSSTAKPIGSSYQQTQFGSTSSKFGQNSQPTFGSGLVSTTVKPVGSSFQQTQFGSTGSQYGLNSQSTFGSGSVSTTAKPIGSSYQQTQFGSTSSKYGQNSQPTFGSGLVSTTVKPVGSSYQQTQFGSTGSRFGQNSQSTFGSGAVSTTTKPLSGSYQPLQPVSKPQTTQGSSFTYTQSQTQYGQKPVTTTQTGSTSQQTQFGSTGSQFGLNSQSSFGSGSVSTTAKPIGSSYQYTQFGSTGSRFGQNSQSAFGSGAVSTTTKPLSGSYQPLQPVSKPQTTQGSSFTYTQSQTQYGQKPVTTTQTRATSQQTQFGSSGSQFGLNSQSSFGSGSVSTTAKPIGSSYQQTQFGSTGSRFGQNSQSTFGSGAVSTTTKPLSGSYQPLQPVSKPQTTQGSSFTYTQSQTQYGQKPVTTTQIGATSQQTQFGSTGSKFGQNSQPTFGSGLVSTSSKPIGSSYQQTQFGSTGSQFGQTSQSTFGSGSVSSTIKPFGSSYQQTQFGSTGSRFGQNSQSTFGSGSVSTTAKPSFGSYQQAQLGTKPQTSQGSSFTYTQSQTQYGQKPVSTTQTGVTSQQTQFVSSGSKFGQNSQPTFGSGFVSTTAKPFGSSYQQTQFGSTGSRFGQNSQSTFGSGAVSTTTKPLSGSYQPLQPVSKPQTTQGSSFTYTQSQTQYGQKPVTTTQTGATSQQTQFGSTGSQYGLNSQSTFGSGFVSTTAKPTGSTYQQTQFGSTGSKFGQNSQSAFGSGAVSTTAKPSFGSYQPLQPVSKPQTSQGSSFTYTQTQTQYGQKPVTTTQTGATSQQTQFGSSGSQFGLNSQSSFGSGSVSTTAKPIGSSYQQTQFGSTGSRFGQNFQSTFGSGAVSTTVKPIGTSYQQTQFVSSGSKFGQNSQPTFGSGLVSTTSKPLFGQTSFGSATQNNLGTISQAQPVQTVQYGISSQNTQVSTQFGSTPSRFGESSQSVTPTITTISQTVQPSPFAQKPIQAQFGSSTAHFGQKPQSQASAFASSSGSNVIPFGSTQTVSKYQQSSQFGVQNKGVVVSTQKPIISSLSQTNNQKYQYTQSQFGQGLQSNVGNGQVGQTTFGSQFQKPFGSQSTQTTYQQTQFTQGQKPFGSSQGSLFQFGQSAVDQPTQSTVQTSSVTGYNYQKPQSVLTTQYGGQGNGQDQKVQQTQSNYNAVVSTSQTPINSPTSKPFGISSSQGTFQQSQSNVGSSQFGSQSVKPTEFSGPVIQTSYNKFSGKPFQPISTVSTQGSVQSQSSAVATSQFGIGSQSVVGSTPEYTVQPSQGVVLPSQNPSHFSVEPVPSVPSRVGSNEGLTVSTVQSPIIPVPGYEIVTSNQGASHSFVGEQFGGPRDPPRFDDKTGYHY